MTCARKRQASECLEEAPPRASHGDGGRGVGIDRLREFLETVRGRGVATGHFRGLLHILIGRRVTLTDGTPISAGMSWRDAAAVLKKYRWDRESVRELGIDPAELPPRDREKFWYLAITRAGLGTPQATAEADEMKELLQEMGYQIG